MKEFAISKFQTFFGALCGTILSIMNFWVIGYDITASDNIKYFVIYPAAIIYLLFIITAIY